MTNTLKSGDAAVINFGDGFTTPVTILGKTGEQYRVACSLNKSWQPNSAIAKDNNKTFLNHQGHKILIDILGDDGEQSRIWTLLNNSWIDEFLVSSVEAKL